MNVLVTGATGFIGRALVERLVFEGHQVTILSRKLRNLKPDKADFYPVSYEDKEVLRKALKNKEIVFHLAGLINAPGESPHFYYQANVLPTKNLLDTVDRSVLKSFVFCSSVAVYGKLRKLPTDEKITPQPDNLYGQSKYEAEKICQNFLKKEKLPVVIVRPTWVYGPGDKRTFKLFKAIEKRIFPIIGKGKVAIHPVFVSDLVEALKGCAFNQEAQGKVFVIGGGEVVELNYLIKLIAEALDKPVPRLHIPVSLTRAGISILNLSFCLFSKKPPFSQRRLEFFTRDQHYDISLAQKVLSFEPQYSLVQGIQLTVDWYRKAGWL